MNVIAQLLMSAPLIDRHDPNKLEKSMLARGLVTYGSLNVHQRITFKGLISGDKALNQDIGASGREELEIVMMIKELSSWPLAINILLDKWQWKE